MVTIVPQRVHNSQKKQNRSVGSVPEFQQNEPQNRQEFVTLMNNKATAIPKMMELPGVK